MPVTTKLTRRVKVKKSITLSVETLAFVTDFKQQHRIASESETIERLLQQMRRAQLKLEIDRAYTAYYDSAPAKALQEEDAWADAAGLALAGFSE